MAPLHELGHALVDRCQLFALSKDKDGVDSCLEILFLVVRGADENLSELNSLM